MTESDREWLLGVLAASEKRLHARFDSVETRLDTLETRLDTLETRLDSLELRMSRLEEELPAAIERLETKLLTAFHSCASLMEMRVKSHTAVLRVLDGEIEAIKDKLDPKPPH